MATSWPKKSTTNLPLPDLPTSATISHGFKSLASGSLLSVGQICDHKCTVVFTEKAVHMYKNPDIEITTLKPSIFPGTRDAPTQSIYNIKLPVPVSPPHAINSLQLQSLNAVKLPSIPSRQNCLLPWDSFISSHFHIDQCHRCWVLTLFPWSNFQTITSYRPHSEATTLGHQHAQRSNLRSTRKTLPAFNATSYRMIQPAYQERPGHRTQHV